jgi:hypothetical protein
MLERNLIDSPQNTVKPINIDELIKTETLKNCELIIVAMIGLGQSFKKETPE